MKDVYLHGIPRNRKKEKKKWGVGEVHEIVIFNDAVSVVLLIKRATKNLDLETLKNTRYLLWVSRKLNIHIRNWLIGLANIKSLIDKNLNWRT